MNELKFIGIGSAFNTYIGNTSAFIKNNESIILIDSGGTVFHRMMELKLFEGLNKINIIITHTHPDHVGSLGEVIFYSYYIIKIIPKIYFPNAEWIRAFLKYIGVEDNMYELVDEMNTVISIGKSELISLSFLPVSHIDTLPSFGFVIERNGKRYYYSGDSNNLPVSVLADFKEDKIEAIYQDTCGLEYDGNAHLSLEKLYKLIPKSLSHKVYCIHHDSFLDYEKVARYGFKIPEIYNI